MRLPSSILGAMALACALAGPAAAQLSPVASPGAVTPAQALAFGAQGSAATPVSALTPLPVATLSAKPIATLKRSTTATAGGAWQVLAPPDAARRGLVLYNPSAGAQTFAALDQGAPSSSDVIYSLAAGTQANALIPSELAGRRIWAKSATTGDVIAAEDVFSAPPPQTTLQWYPAGGRMGINYGLRTVSAGTTVSYSHTRSMKNGPVAGRIVHAVWTGWYVAASGSGSGGELAVGNDYYKEASIEYPVGTTPKRFLVNGSGAIIVPNGGEVASDVDLGVTLPAGATYKLHEFTSNTVPGGAVLGTSLPFNRATIATGYPGGITDRYATGSAVTSQVGVIGGETGTVTAADVPDATYIGLVPVLPPGASLPPAVALMGDSITHGRTMTDNQQSDSNGYVGPWEEWYDSTLGYSTINFGVSATLAYQWANIDSGLYPQTLSLISRFASHVNILLGTNDQAYTAAQMQANIERISTVLSLAGKYVYASTIPPRTNAGNTATTSAPAETARLAFNTACTSQGFKSVRACVDLNKIFDNGAGLWASTSYESDGIHPTNTGAAAAASGLAQPPGSPR